MKYSIRDTHKVITNIEKKERMENCSINMVVNVGV